MATDTLDISREALTRLKEHLPKGDDLILVILKGHLLIEEQINGILQKVLNDPQALSRAKLSFDQRFQIYCSVLGKKYTPHARTIKKLNQIRNKIAHNLEPPDLLISVEEFCKDILPLTASFKENQGVSVAERVRIVIAYLCGHLSGLRDKGEKIQFRLRFPESLKIRK